MRTPKKEAMRRKVLRRIVALWLIVSLTGALGLVSVSRAIRHRAPNHQQAEKQSVEASGKALRGSWVERESQAVLVFDGGGTLRVMGEKVGTYRIRPSESEVILQFDSAYGGRRDRRRYQVKGNRLTLVDQATGKRQHYQRQGD
jgi:hypothetical protein